MDQQKNAEALVWQISVWDRMVPVYTREIDKRRRTLPLPDPSSGSEAFYRSRSSADSTIIMSGSNFRQGQRGSLSSRWSLLPFLSDWTHPFLCCRAVFH